MPVRQSAEVTMPLSQSNQTFFGMDTRAVAQGLSQAWGQLRESPAMAWMVPAVGVRWSRSSGQEQSWQTDGRCFLQKASGRAVRFSAVELPEEVLLRRSLVMPRMSLATMADAVALDARSSSPFAPNDLIWGWSFRSGAEQAQAIVELVLASRKSVEKYLASHTPEGVHEPEVWCDSHGAGPIVLRGFGEVRREQVQSRWKVINGWLLGVMCLLFAALAVTPTLQLRARALQAVAAYEELIRAATPALKQREALVLAETQLSELRSILAEQVEPLKVLEMLTQAIPDDTSLHSLQIQGLKVSLAGQTGNAAALIQQLGNHPALREVKAPTAATRPPGATKDTFSIEAMIDAKSLRGGVQAKDPLAPADAASTPASDPVPVVPEAAAGKQGASKARGAP